VVQIIAQRKIKRMLICTSVENFTTGTYQHATTNNNNNVRARKIRKSDFCRLEKFGVLLWDLKKFWGPTSKSHGLSGEVCDVEKIQIFLSACNSGKIRGLSYRVKCETWKNI
jgi:hypothetical protein